MSRREKAILTVCLASALFGMGFACCIGAIWYPKSLIAAGILFGIGILALVIYEKVM